VSAAASIIFIGTIRSFLEKKKPSSSINSGNLNSKYFGRVLRTEKADVNIALTAETAMASIKAVKKAYHILLLNIDTVVPKDLLDRILHQILTTDGKHWSCGLPTFDELAKNQKNEALRGEKEMETVREKNRERDSEREMKKIAAENSEKLAKMNKVTVIPHLLDRARNKDEIDVRIEKSTSPIPFLPRPAPPLNVGIQEKYQETDSNAKKIIINQYIVKSEISRTDSPLIITEYSQNKAVCRPIMSSSLTIKEERDMNHSKTKIRFDIGNMKNNLRSTKNMEVRFDSHLDMEEGVAAGMGVGNPRDQYKHEDSIPMGGMGVLSTRKLQKISS
jgi:hypothetical protein